MKGLGMAQAVLMGLENVAGSGHREHILLTGIRKSLREWITKHESYVHAVDTNHERVDKTGKSEHDLARLQARLQEQEKDIEELTCACQVLLRRIKEMEDEQRRNPKALV
jgi:hypothetical protein